MLGPGPTMSLTADHRRLVLGQALGGAVINFFLNGGIAWLTFPPVDALPLWARGNCVAGDTIGTSFFLPLITCIILTLVTRKVLRGGSMPWIPLPELPAVARLVPRNFVARGALVGLGIPEFEAQQYEGKLRQGNILLAIHADDDDQAGRIRTILTEENAEDIITGSEASVPSGGNQPGGWRHPTS